MLNFPAQFCLGRRSTGLSASESRELFLNEYVYSFSVDYN